MKEQLLFIRSLAPKYDDFKRSQVLNLTPEEQAKLNNAYKEIYGRNLPSCSSCFADAFLSLLIFSQQRLDEIEKEEKAAAIESEIQSAFNEIELAQLADDEHKPKRKRR